MTKQISLDEYYKNLCDLASLVERQDKQIEQIRSTYAGDKIRDAQYREEEARKKEVRSRFLTDFESALRMMQRRVVELRKIHPQLATMRPESVVATPEVFPSSIVFGKLHLRRSDFRKDIPFPEKFPPSHVYSIRESDAAIAHVQTILLRMLLCIPIGKLHIYAADPRNGGAALGEIRQLLKEKSIFPQMRVLTKSRDIADTISMLRDMMDERTQQIFTDGSTWMEYNEHHPEQQLPYTVFVLYDTLSQINSDASWQLARLIERGPDVGILPLIVFRDEELDDHAHKELRELLPKIADSPIQFPKKLSVFACSYALESLPEGKIIRELVNLICHRARQQKTQLMMNRLWQDEQMFAYDASEGITAPIGWDADGKPVNFRLGFDGALQHTLVAGSTGSGKSNLLHVLIHSLCHRYHPSELRLYMLDFKQGVEFKTYAAAPLPHAKLVAIEGDAEYGISVLTHLCEEMERRNQLFKASGERSLADYRKKYPDALPRLLLIIDEFQKLFEEDNRSSQQSNHAQRLMKDLLRLGRSAGIHVLLSTQTLSGLHTVYFGELLGQLGCRIVLQCTAADSVKVLDSNNSAAARISSPPEGIINYKGGAVDGNVTVIIPKADTEGSEKHLQEVLLSVEGDKDLYEPVVFDGSKPPTRAAKAEGNTGMEVQLGKDLTFEQNLFSLSFDDADQAHLFIAGEGGGEMMQGMLQSIADAFNNRDDVDIVLIHAHKSSKISIPDVQLHRIQDERNILADLAATMNEKKRLIVLSSLENSMDFVDPAPAASFRLAKDVTEFTPRVALDKILSEGAEFGNHVVWLAEKPRMCGSQYKKLLTQFDRRIMYGMAEATAKTLCMEPPVSFKDLSRNDRALYLNMASSQHCWFRPFISQ